jgi:hypothetical protein
LARIKRTLGARTLAYVVAAERIVQRVANFPCAHEFCEVRTTFFPAVKIAAKPRLPRSTAVQNFGGMDGNTIACFNIGMEKSSSLGSFDWLIGVTVRLTRYHI